MGKNIHTWYYYKFQPIEDIAVTQTDIASRLNSDILDDLEDDLEPDPEDADPRFMVKPGSQEVEEGEMVSFTCQVQGSAHTGDSTFIPQQICLLIGF